MISYPSTLDPRMHNNLYSSCSSLLKRHKICNRQYLFALLPRKSRYHVNCLLAYDTHLKKKIIIKFQDLDRKLCVRVRPFFLVLWIILAQHRLGGGSKKIKLKRSKTSSWNENNKKKISKLRTLFYCFSNDIRIYRVIDLLRI